MTLARAGATARMTCARSGERQPMTMKSRASQMARTGGTELKMRKMRSH